MKNKEHIQNAVYYAQAHDKTHFLYIERGGKIKKESITCICSNETAKETYLRIEEYLENRLKRGDYEFAGFVYDSFVFIDVSIF